MTSKNGGQNYGLPAPVIKLTMEQDLKMRLLKDKLNSGEIDYKDVVTVFLAMQKQNFVLGNSLKNLIDHWPHEEIFLIHSGKGVPLKIQP